MAPDYVGCVALLPTLLAIAIGIGLGVYWGGAPANLLEWRPLGAMIGLGGVSLLVLVDVVPFGGPVMTFLRIIALGAIVAFGVINLRIGGMVLVVVGVGLNLLVTVLNWGMPVSSSALVSAGIISADEVDMVSLHGGRSIADGALLGFLGGVIPLPWGHVISIGDLIALFGIVLVTASICRRFEVPGGRGRGPGGGRPIRSGPSDYRTALDALGRGPAPSRGPGLHPSRLPGERGPAKRRPGSGAR